MTPNQRPVALFLLCLLPLTLGCRRIDSGENLQTLAGDLPPEVSASQPAPPAGGGPPAGDEELGGFPLGGSVFPGLGSRLHSALCDPALDPDNACI